MSNVKNPRQHPDGFFYYRSGGEIVGCREDMFEAYPNDMILPDDPEFVKRWKEFSANEYIRHRQAEYPDWQTQLNKIYDDGLTKWKSEMVDPVKAKWPKDNSGPV